MQELREKYEILLSQPGVVGLAIATRSDALPQEVLDYLEELSHRTFLMVELGLQSAFDETAQRIHRGHDWKTFVQGVQALRQRGIWVCVHIINGLPGEDRDMMVKTVRRVAALDIQCIKIHLLHILKGTQMEQQYERGEIEPITLMAYAETVCDRLEQLPPEVVVQRVTGDGLKDQLIAPLWSLKKFVVMNEIDKEMARRGSFQGRHWNK